MRLCECCITVRSFNICRVRLGLLLSLFLCFSFPGLAADLRVGVAALPRSADPHFGASRVEQFLHSQIYEGLVDTDAQGRPVPRLAERWERIDDGAWLFRLRHNVRFQNGQPFTARDVIFSFCRTGMIQGSAHPFAHRLAAAETVEMVNNFTLLIRMRDRDMLFPREIASIPIVAAPAGVADDWHYDSGTCQPPLDPDDKATSLDFGDPGLGAGTGPFRLRSYQTDEIVAVRNPDYWGELAPWEHYRLIRLAPEEQVAAALEGKVDVLDNPPLNAMEFLKGKDDLRLVSFPSTALSYLQFNRRKEGGDKANHLPFQDVRVRQAINLAIPRNVLAQRVLAGVGSPAGQMPLQGSPSHAPDLAIPDHDPVQARRLLAEAGYPAGFQAVLVTGVAQRRVADVIAHFLANIGIRITVQEETQDRLIPRLIAGDFDLYCVGWIFDPSDIPGSYQALLGSGSLDGRRGLNNYGFYENKELDRLLARIRWEPAAAMRDQLTRRASRLMHDDVAWIPLAHTTSRWVLRAGLSMEGRLDRSLRANRVRPDETQADAAKPSSPTQP
ncbi:ABC transporter substrate-binding protein [Niveispirillum sp. BGYR6]|uniref:ABC transporter substrate-binding protein n=1 Tax=Niveispirillum sp. BGYR6 TaxID=2971249 RepID=UPI0022B94F6D|nr:ABC transporter substrate-binding protein [Niveispirillum sp. BGYR6]